MTNYKFFSNSNNLINDPYRLMERNAYKHENLTMVARNRGCVFTRSEAVRRGKGFEVCSDISNISFVIICREYAQRSGVVSYCMSR
jgi:hypothetical protein